MGTTFDEFVGDREKFFTDYFDRAPMLRSGAPAHRLGEFPTPADLDDILALETVAPSYPRVSKGGAGVPSNKLTEVSAEALAATVEVVLFVTPAGNPGFTPHHDSVDVSVVQTHGRKTWRVWATAEDRAGDEASYTTEELGRPERRSDVVVDIGVGNRGRTGLTVNNHQLAVPDAVATALRSLGTGRSVTADQFFPGVAAGRSIGAARGLARLGGLEIADEQEDVHST